MFSKRQNQFRSIKELKDLHPLLNELHHKEHELKQSIDGNAGAAGYKKSVIITHLCEQIDEIIFQFNRLPMVSERTPEMNNILILVTHLKNAVFLCLEKHRTILNTPRQTMTYTLSQNTVPVTVTSSMILGVGTGSFLFASMPFLGMLALGATADMLGVTSKKTASISILERLLDKLEVIYASLNFTINELTGGFACNDHVLCCPITLQRMKHPVLCLLDNRMYEKNAIEQWLTEHKTAPFNRKPLLPEQTIDSVLIENISLREAIEDLEHGYVFNDRPSAPPIDEVLKPTF